MSPLRKPVVLDNDVISRLFSAGELTQFLRLWPTGSFVVTVNVFEEAGNWPARGAELVCELEALESSGAITRVELNESCEEEVFQYARLRLPGTLGYGESASIAIAACRCFDVATDDLAARGVCSSNCPKVRILGTGTLLNIAVQDGLISGTRRDGMRDKIRRQP